MKLKEWCIKQGICYHTGFRWFHKKLIPNSYQTETGTIIVNEKEITITNHKIVTYSRVSSYNRKKEIEYQVKRCRDYCVAKGYNLHKEYKEIASGMNDNRPIFWKMLGDSPTIIIVENKDRLTRFGFNYIQRLLEKQNCTIEVINQDHEDESDLIKDLVSIITSFCCRLYGIRRGQNKTKKIKDIINAKSL